MRIKQGLCPPEILLRILERPIDMIEYVNTRKTEAILISVDFEKAFNRVDNQAM